MNRRIRWAVRGTLFLGVAASITANVLHARDNPISQAIAAWPPLALLITVEVVARVPITRRWFAVVRVLATAVIAGIAAWVSYWHMAGVALRYGEATGAAHLLPLSVDGLIVVASVCLVELGGRMCTAGEINEGGSNGGQVRQGGGEARQTHREAPRPGQDSAGGDGQSVAGDQPAEQGEEVAVEESTRGERDGQEHRQGAGGSDGEIGREHREAEPEQSADAGAGEAVRRSGEVDEVAPAQFEPPKQAVRKPHTTNPDRVRRAYERNPEADPTKVAKRLNLSLATVKKYRPPKEQPEQVNGKVPELEGAK